MKKKTDLIILIDARQFIQKLSNDPHLWFVPDTWGEAQLQWELRKLMAVIRGENPDKVKVWGKFGIEPKAHKPESLNKKQRLSLARNILHGRD